MSFAPLGYVKIEQFTETHLLANWPLCKELEHYDRERVNSERFAKARRALTVKSLSAFDNALAVGLMIAAQQVRQLLYNKEFDAYVGTSTGLVQMGANFWLGDNSVRVILHGKVRLGGRPEQQPTPGGETVYIKEPTPHSELIDSKGKEASLGGRPSKQEAAAAAYWQLYPQGHEATGDQWKNVERKLSERMGFVSIATIKRAIGHKKSSKTGSKLKG